MSKRLPRGAIKQSLAPHFARQIRPALKDSTKDLLGEYEVPSLQYLKSAFNLSNEELV